MVFTRPLYFLRRCRMQCQRVNLFPSFNQGQLLPCHIKIFFFYWSMQFFIYKVKFFFWLNFCYLLWARVWLFYFFSLLWGGVNALFLGWLWSGQSHEASDSCWHELSSALLSALMLFRAFKIINPVKNLLVMTQGKLGTTVRRMVFWPGTKLFIFAFRNYVGRLERGETAALWGCDPQMIFGAEEQWQMAQAFAACRGSKIIASGRTDADFIWIRLCLVSPGSQHCSLSGKKKSKENVVMTGTGNHGHSGAIWVLSSSKHHLWKWSWSYRVTSAFPSKIHLPFNLSGVIRGGIYPFFTMER